MVGIHHSRNQNYVKFQHQPNFAIWVLESAKLVAWQHSFCMAAWQPWGRVLCGHQFWAVSLWSCNVADVALQHVNQESLGRCFVSQNMETSFIFFHHLSQGSRYPTDRGPNFVTQAFIANSWYIVRFQSTSCSSFLTDIIAREIDSTISKTWKGHVIRVLPFVLSQAIAEIPGFCWI